MIDPRMSDFHINIRVLDCVQFPKCLATGTVDVLGTLLHSICSDKDVNVLDLCKVPNLLLSELYQKSSVRQFGYVNSKTHLFDTSMVQKHDGDYCFVRLAATVVEVEERFEEFSPVYHN